jgi:hypothetical protein
MPRENTRKHVARGERGKWLPGASPNPGGRPRQLADVRDLARQHTEEAVECLVRIMRDSKSEAAQVAAANAILDRGWGKATQPLTGDGLPPEPFIVKVNLHSQEEIEERCAGAEDFAEPGSKVAH